VASVSKNKGDSVGVGALIREGARLLGYLADIPLKIGLNECGVDFCAANINPIAVAAKEKADLAEAGRYAHGKILSTLKKERAEFLILGNATPLHLLR